MEQDLRPTHSQMSSQLEAELPSESDDMALLYKAVSIRINVYHVLLSSVLVRIYTVMTISGWDIGFGEGVIEGHKGLVRGSRVQVRRRRDRF